MKFGVTELLIILAVVIVLFGPTQIPKLTRMFGKGVKNFRKGMAEDDDEEDDDDDDKKSKKSEKKADKKVKKSDKKAEKEEKEESDEEDA